MLRVSSSTTTTRMTTKRMTTERAATKRMPTKEDDHKEDDHKEDDHKKDDHQDPGDLVHDKTAYIILGRCARCPDYWSHLRAQAHSHLTNRLC
jgi:hypothetical protein